MKTIGYHSEQELVRAFLDNLAEGGGPWGQVRVTTEFEYSRGRVDVVAVTRGKEVIAIEAKLRKWRDGAQQAYRNRCFAHYSYLLLPETSANKLVLDSGQIERMQLGILVLAGKEVLVSRVAPRSQPIQPWLCDLAANSVR